MELPKKVGYVVATDNGELLCMADDGSLYLMAYPFTGDVTDAFLLCKYKSGAVDYAREWHERLFFGFKTPRVKPVKVVVEIREFKEEKKQ